VVGVKSVDFYSPMTVSKKPDHRGEHEGNRKTIARGMPGDSGVTVVTTTTGVAVFSARQAAGASSARHSLRPLSRGRDLNIKPRAKNTQRDREAVSAV
jgi:hypothetical protein